MKYYVSRSGLFAFTAMWAFSFYVLSSTAIAQPDSTSESRTENSVVKLDAPVVQRLGVTSGFGSFIPNRWGVLSAEVSNPTDRSQKLTIRANWETDNPANNAVQFTRTFVVPAMTRRVVWYPIRVPDHEPENERLKIGRLMLRSIISREEDGKEVMVLSPLGKIHAAAQINTEFNKPAMGFIPEDETELLEMRAYLASRGVDVEDVNSNTLRMLIAIRDKQGLGSAMFKPKASGIAPNPLSLDGLDQLVIADGSYSKDVSLTDSIRSWIMSGGRAWIMLDRTGTAFAQRLLGDTLSLVELETQQLNRVVIIDVHDGQHHVGAAVEYDQPVKLLTVLVENVDVTHEVNGVPAAFWLKYGNGEILFTTLSSEAWTRPKAHPSITTALLQREPLEDLMKRFYTPTDKALTDFSVTENEIDEMTVNQTDDSQVVIDKKQRLAEFTATSKVKDIDGFLKQKVGFQIVSREHIMVVFGLFCALIVGLGYFLHRKGRMELLLAGGPVIVIVLSSYLYIIGAVKRSTLDSLTASVQFINAEHGSRDLVIRGMGAVYSEESVQENIEATAGGVFWPDMQELTGTNIRMVWTDMDRWHWEGLMMPGGTVRTYPFEKPLHLNEAIQATATLSPQGLVGTYRLPGFENLEHAILVSPTGERAQVDLIDGKLMVHNEEL
ncbi:MAG: hypothetical protein VX738_10580, partial [Planctomycetota bacterium]|nr:hypothetical protein [Planctomycetota bacterium]